MQVAAKLRARCAQCRGLPPEADGRLERSCAWSPAFTRLLDRYPDYWAWVEAEYLAATEGQGRLSLASQWEAIVSSTPLKEGARGAWFDLLRKFRKKQSFRIAYREVNELASLAETLYDLTALAELCLQQVYHFLSREFLQRFGQPWNEELQQPAHLCVLALGKLGAEELNFCSDIDLMFLYEGEGSCRRGDKKPVLDNREFFSRLAREVIAVMQEPSEYGALYTVDVRLRPDGQGSPLVRSTEAAANYYWARGQTWERLMLSKARVVCGDVATGEDFLEAVQAFRYPRHSLANFAAEVAGVKLRMEREVLGQDKLMRDIKNGYGGIREIEFIAQCMQCVQGGRNPFLQTHSTPEALERLQRYQWISHAEFVFLKDAWERLRTLENRLQIHEDAQTHLLPAETDAEGRQRLAASFGHKDGGEAFFLAVERLREEVHTLYARYLPYTNREVEIQNWFMFLGGQEPVPELAGQIQRWFPHAENAVPRLRQFILEPGVSSVSREQVLRFLDIARSFEKLLPQLARPMQTLERVAAFTKSYKARTAFFKMCAEYPELFRILCFLFDRSVFIFELLNSHPEIIEELLYVPHIREKSFADTLREIADFAPKADFEHFLWFYVRAEQVRIAIAQLIHQQSISDTESALTTLADATLQSVLERVDPGGKLCVIALGKYGGGELTFGSDLDLLLLGPQDALREALALTRILAKRILNSSIYALDLRLRPHGDAGTLVISVESFARYHASGQAQPWERQILTRARFVAGNANLAQAFKQWRTGLLYGGKPDPKTLRAIWQMRQRIVEEKAADDLEGSAFKAGVGGLLDIEFLAQTLQLAEGYRRPELRTSRTRRVLQNVWNADSPQISALQSIREHYEYLRTLELYLRRYRNESVDCLPENPDDLRSLAHWMGETRGFMAKHAEKMKKCRKELQEFLEEYLNLYIS